MIKIPAGSHGIVYVRGEPSSVVQTSTERAPKCASSSSRTRTSVARFAPPGHVRPSASPSRLRPWAPSWQPATSRLNDLHLTERPIRITKELVDDTVAQFEGILERAPLETRVATVRDLFERVDVDSRELKAVAVWNMTTDHGVNRSDSVSSWLRR